MPRHLTRKPLAIALSAALLTTQLAGCGTILYPERSGQEGGQLDAGIVALDALGLLFFLVPGLIAFAVDFSNGTIYLPGGEVSQLDEAEMRALTASGNGPDREALARILSERVVTDRAIRGADIERTTPIALESLPTRVAAGT